MNYSDRYNPYFFEMFYNFSNFARFLQVKKLVEVEKGHSPVDEKHS